MLNQPFTDLPAWTDHFRQASIPVLTATVEDLALLAQAEDEHGNVDAHRVSKAIGDDPLMTLRLLVLAARQRHARQVTDAETVTAAVMMMGIGPFFRNCADLIAVETLLAPHPQAWVGLQHVLRRSHRAARFAIGFAVHRMEADAAVMRLAALLHDFAEMLLWCHAPALATRIAERQRTDPTLRSTPAQREVLHVSLLELEQALMRAWHLPELLIRLTDDRAKGVALIYPQMRLVKLAVQLARHTASGWDNAALPDDLNEIAELLNLSQDSTQRLLRDIDDD
jgi:HD-like signal output (HDOD) protein